MFHFLRAFHSDSAKIVVLFAAAEHLHGKVASNEANTSADSGSAEIKARFGVASLDHERHLLGHAEVVERLLNHTVVKQYRTVVVFCEFPKAIVKGVAI